MDRYIRKLTDRVNVIHTFEYGYLDKNNVKHPITAWNATMWKSFVRGYRYLSPTLVSKYRIGICLDINNYLYRTLSKLSKSKFSMFAIHATSEHPYKFRNQRSEHYFLVNEYKSKWLLIYSSSTNVIKPFDTLADALAFEIIGFKRQHPNLNWIAVFKYNDHYYNQSYTSFVRARIDDFKNKLPTSDLSKFHPHANVYVDTYANIGH